MWLASVCRAISVLTSSAGELHLEALEVGLVLDDLDEWHGVWLNCRMQEWQCFLATIAWMRIGGGHQRIPQKAVSHLAGKASHPPQITLRNASKNDTRSLFNDVTQTRSLFVLFQNWVPEGLS